jgi:hypothetical protein
MAVVNMNEYSILEQLAPELLVRVLACIDIRDVVELAACNSFLLIQANLASYQDCPQRWQPQYFVPRRSAL